MISILQLSMLKDLFKGEKEFIEFQNKITSKMNNSTVVLVALDEKILCGMISPSKTHDIMSSL
jgi:hypothetical protein